MSDDDDRVSAGELRAMGCVLPDTVPDCATVRRGSIEIVEADPVHEPGDAAAGTVRVRVLARLTEPFRWYVVKATGAAVSLGSGKPD